MQFRDLINLIRRRRRTLQPMPFHRVARYYQHRIGRLPGHPHDIAAGFAAGVGVSFTPFLGLHILLGFVICFIGRFSPVAMVIGTVLSGNPWTFPLIWVTTYKLGHFLLLRYDADVDHPQEVADMSLGELLSDPLGLFLPMTVGGVPLGLLCGLVTYAVARMALTRYQAARARRRAENGNGRKNVS